MPRVLIYRSELLTYSETFIRNQVRSLRRYASTYVGLGPARTNQPLGEADVVRLTQSRRLLPLLRKTLYKFIPVAPLFHSRLKRRADARLIHAHLAEDGMFALPIARRLGLPLMVTLHGSYELLTDEFLASYRNGRMFLKRRQDLFRRAELFLCVSRYIYRRALEAGFPREKLMVHYIGQDLGRFAVDPSVERDPNMLLFVGRLNERKGLHYLLQALPAVLERHAAMQLHVIGDGEEKSALQEYARERGLPVHFHGALTSEEILAFLQRAKLFCAPSVTLPTGDSEALGMVYLEAQSCGLPVVAFDHGGVGEAVVQGRTGLLAPERDAAALAACLNQLLTDDDLWQSCSRNAPEHVRANFDLVKQSALLEQIYDQVVGKGYRSEVA